MATTGGSKNSTISGAALQQELTNHPGRFDFFQAVRLLHRLLADREAVGTFAAPQREVVRFTVNNFLGFPPSQIHELNWTEHAAPRMSINFFGLTGPMGVLPHRYTELIRERNRSKDRTLQDFFDFFNHRLISLFYRAWEKYRFYVGYERNREDRLSRCLLSLVGLGLPALEARQQPVRDETFLFYSGLFSLQPRSAVACEQILAEYFDVPVEIEQFVGAWRTLEDTDQCRLRESVPYSDQLGFGAVIGEEVWDRQSRVRIRLGPLSARQYRSFLPNGNAWEALRTLTRFFGGGEIEFEIQLILREAEVPSCTLGATDADAPLLGWLSWVKSNVPLKRNPEDTVLLLA
jgi:type VI secretion system protein ImpH